MPRSSVDSQKIAIESALEYGLIDPKIERHNNILHLVAVTPSSLPYKTKVSRWFEGARPPKGYMCDLAVELNEYGLELKGFTTRPANKTGSRNHLYLVAKAESGEEWECRLNHWANKAAKPPLKFLRDIAAEVQDYGLKLVESKLEKVSSGAFAAFLYIRLPDNTLYRTSQSGWLSGTRPKRSVGRYAPKAVEKNPQLAATEVSLYYVKFCCRRSAAVFYKIGITVRGIKYRFHEHIARGFDYSVIREWRMSALTASRLEDRIKGDYFLHRFKPPEGFPNGGTECFSHDILDMDNATT